MEEPKILLPVGMTNSDLELLKKKHKTLFSSTVVDEEGIPRTAIFRQPDIDAISEMEKKMQESEINAIKFMYHYCKVAADPEIDEDISLKLSVMNDLQKVVAKKKTTFQRL